MNPSFNARGEIKHFAAEHCLAGTPAVAGSFVLAWFLLALILSSTDWLSHFSANTLFEIGAIETIVAFAVLYLLCFRILKAAGTRGLKILTQGQTLRFYGLLALIKAHQHILPAVFAVPTGIIDVTFAITALMVANRLTSKRERPGSDYFIWHVLGLIGLGVSMTLAFLTSSNRFGLVAGSLTSQSMTLFPMSLVPTFIGPFVVTLHLMALVTPYVTASLKMKKGGAHHESARNLLASID